MNGTDPTKRTQCDDILEYLELRGSITPMQALRELGCMRLAARIKDLRDAGHPIVAGTKAITARNGRKAHVAIYRLQDAT